MNVRRPLPAPFRTTLVSTTLVRPALALTLGLGLTLAGCGDADSAGGDGIASAGGGTAQAAASASASAPVDRQEAGLKFAQCMREHGIDMPDPGAGGGVQIRIPKGTDPAKLKKAQEECQPILQSAVGDRLKADPEMQDKILKFVQCLREHGIDVPDPGTSGGIRMRAGEGQEQKLEEAQEACKEFRPNVGGQS